MEEKIIEFHKVKKDKRKKENFNVWVDSIIGKWAFIYTDNKKRTTIMNGYESENLDLNRISLIPFVEFLEWIKDDNKESKKYINLHTNNLYLKSLITEWIDKWKKTQFKIDDQFRPNTDILKKIEYFKSIMNIQIKFIFKPEEEENIKKLQEIINPITPEKIVSEILDEIINKISPVS